MEIILKRPLTNLTPAEAGYIALSFLHEMANSMELTKTKASEVYSNSYWG